jgi:zinc transport system ATP-binding protein
MPKELIKLTGVWAGYQGKVVLEDINLSIEEEDFLGIIGPNGGGKTTLLKLMLGLTVPSRGSVTVLGGRAEKGRNQIGYVPQYNPFDHEFPISVREVALMGHNTRTGLMKRYSKKDKKLADEALEMVKMANLAEKQMGKLSGGEQQRVFIARALLSEPKILLLDEPTSSVDSNIETELYELLQKLNKKIAIVLVSHDIGAISINVNKIACLNRRLYYHGTKEITDEVLEATYKCPVQMIAHGTVPHRVLKDH